MLSVKERWTVLGLSWRLLAVHSRLTARCLLSVALLACLGAIISAKIEERAVVERNRDAMVLEAAKLGSSFSYAMNDALGTGTRYLDLLSDNVRDVAADGQLTLPQIIEPEEVAYIGSWGPDGKQRAGSGNAPALLPASALEAGDDSMLIDRPQHMIGSVEFVIPLWRTVRNQRGERLGTVGVAIRPNRIIQFFGDLVIGHIGVIGLLDTRRQALVMRIDALGAIEWGLSMAQPALWDRLKITTTGEDTHVSAIDGRERTYVYRPVEGSPLVVSVGIDPAEIGGRMTPVINNIRLKAVIEIISFIVGTLLMLGLLRSLTELHRSLDMNQQFMARISHELRTPLNAIIGFSEMMTEEVLGPLGVPLYAEYCRMIHQSGRSLLMLVDDVLDLTALQVGRESLHLEPVVTRTAVETVLQSLKSKAEAKGIRSAVFCPRQQQLSADVAGFQQILHHLLDNALNFTPEGGRVVVDVHEDLDRGRVLVTVTDSGPGMSEEQIKYAGDPFGQPAAYSRRAGEGSGLGLAIVRALVVAHGGHLTIYNAVPGCRVTVDFAALKETRIL